MSAMDIEEVTERLGIKHRPSITPSPLIPSHAAYCPRIDYRAKGVSLGVITHKQLTESIKWKAWADRGISSSLLYMRLFILAVGFWHAMCVTIAGIVVRSSLEAKFSGFPVQIR
jgi:hypothetical protein